MSYASKKRTSWYIGYTDEDGCAVQQKSAARTKAEATRLADEKERHCEQIRLGIIPRINTALTFEQMAKEYMKSATPMLRSRELVDGYMVNHLIPAFGPMKAVDVGPHEIGAMLASKRGVLAPQTLEHLRANLRALFNFAIRGGIFTGQNPASKVPRVKVPEKPIVFLEAAQVGNLLAAIPQRWRVMFVVAVYTGMRRGELFALRRERVDLERGIITIAASNEGSTKSGRVRIVPVPDELKPILAGHMETLKGALLWESTQGGMLSRNTKLSDVLRTALVKIGLVRAWQHACRRKGCGHREEHHAQQEALRCPKCDFKLWPSALPIPLTFKSLRATFATHVAESTGDIRFVQAVLGHADLATTEKFYSALRGSRLIQQGRGITYPALTGPPVKGSAPEEI
jgi:integrase